MFVAVNFGSFREDVLARISNLKKEVRTIKSKQCFIFCTCSARLGFCANIGVFKPKDREFTLPLCRMVNIKSLCHCKILEKAWTHYQVMIFVTSSWCSARVIIHDVFLLFIFRVTSCALSGVCNFLLIYHSLLIVYEQLWPISICSISHRSIWHHSVVRTTPCIIVWILKTQKKRTSYCTPHIGSTPDLSRNWNI